MRPSSLEGINTLVMPDVPHIALIALYNFESYSIRTLFTILNKYGYKTTAIFFKNLKFNSMNQPSDNEIKKLLSLLSKLKPTIVGISVVSSFYEIASMITKEIQQKLSIPVLWGGPHPTIVPEKCITIADIICIGEGDEAILDLAKAMRDGKEIININNLWFNKNGYVVKNSLRPLMQNLDWIPLLDRSNNDKYWIENDAFLEGDPIWGFDPPKVYVLLASRGCPFQCTYCSNSIFKEIYKNKGLFVRTRSVESVIKELRIAKEQLHINRVFFIDEVFVLNEEWIADFCKRYKKEIGLAFGCELYPTLVREELIAQLADAGLDEVVMGIQSGCELIRNYIFERSGPNRIIEQAAELFRKYKIMPCYDIIMDNPFETESHKRATLNLLLNLPHPFNLNIYSLCWFPETKLTVRALMEGVISEEMVEGQAKKIFKQWRMRIDIATSNEDQFWNSLIFLASLRYNSNRYSWSAHIVPKLAIRLLMDNKLLQRHPRVLALSTLMLGSLIAPSKLYGFPLATYLCKLYSGLKLLLKGKFSVLFLKLKAGSKL